MLNTDVIINADVCLRDQFCYIAFQVNVALFKYVLKSGASEYYAYCGAWKGGTTIENTQLRIINTPQRKLTVNRLPKMATLNDDLSSRFTGPYAQGKGSVTTVSILQSVCSRSRQK
jgi:hypothetical protein